MKKIFSILFITIASLSCSNDKNEVNVPDDVLGFDKMSDIMVDVQLMESQLENMRMVDPTAHDSIGRYYAAIFEKHEIQKAEYDSSLMFYAKHFNLLDSLYNSVFTKLHDLEIGLKDIEYEAEDVRYLTRIELKDALKKTGFDKYIVNNDINFMDARDSLKRFVVTNQDLLDSLKISKVAFVNSFNLYCNSRNRLVQFKAELKN